MDQLSDYDYDLDESLIAQHPLEDRAASRLLWLGRDNGHLEHRQFRDVVDILRPEDVLVLNNTRVTARRLFGNKRTGASVEALLLYPLDAQTYEVLLRPAKRLPEGTRIAFQDNVYAEVLAHEGDAPTRRLRFDEPPPLDHFGEIPLPPYITQKLSEEERYQTVYAGVPGSAAAPTAGLHFTQEILAKLVSNGVRLAEVTLDVGIDTFRPVQTEVLQDHKMHGERCTISPEAAETINSANRRVIAVGTTSVRTLESFAQSDGVVGHGSKVTSIFIRPGYQFQIVQGMFTNFHLPKTTMMMMISAFAGYDSVRAAYAEAQANRYRFLSFGDSMLIL